VTYIMNSPPISLGTSSESDEPQASTSALKKRAINVRLSNKKRKK
ncbi:unnamed protein product, partial [Allacma fusca]